MPTSPPSLKPGLVLGVLLAAAHLFLVLCGALYVPLAPPGTARANVLDAYGRWTGAGSHYSFFAPSIAPSLRVSFDMGVDKGEVVHEGLAFDEEAMKIRAYAMSLNFNDSDDSTTQDNMARAWAAAMFGRHPDAHSVSVRVELMELPTMEEYRAGERPTWVQRYHADFALRPSSSHVQATNP